MTQSSPPSGLSSLESLPTYNAAVSYLQRAPDEREWDEFAGLCEAFFVALEAWVETHPEHSLEALELTAAQQLEALLGDWAGLELQMCWLYPWFVLPWAARLVDEVSLSFQLEYADQLIEPELDSTYLRLQPGTQVEDIPNIIEDQGVLYHLSHETFQRFVEVLPHLERLQTLWLDLPDAPAEGDLSACWAHLSRAKGLGYAELKFRDRDQINAFAAQPWPHLSDLSLSSDNSWTQGSMSAETFPALERLKLDFFWYDETLGNFLTPARFPALSSLELTATIYGGRPLPVEVFAVVGTLPQLTDFGLVQEQTTAASLSQLAEHLPQGLTKLRVRTRQQFSGSEFLKALLQRAPFSHLHSLSLLNTTFEDEVFARFVEMAHIHFPALQVLELSWEGFGSGHVEQLCQHPLLAQLSELSLFDTKLSPDDARLLANAEGFETLSSFFAHVQGAGIFGLDDFRRTYKEQDDEERLAALREILDIETLQYDWEGFCKQLDTWDQPQHFEDVALPYIEQHLSGLPSNRRTLPIDWVERVKAGQDFPALQLIHQAHNIFSQEAISAIARSRHLKNLKSLEISGGDATVTKELVGQMQQAAFWPTLEELIINNNAFAPEDVAPLLNSLRETTVRKLQLHAYSLSQATLPEAALEALEALSTTGHLRDLCLHSIPLRLESFAALLRPEGHLQTLTLRKMYGNNGWLAALVDTLPDSLKQLSLPSNRLQDEDLLALLSQDRLKNIETLDLSRNRLQDLPELSMASWPKLRQLSLSQNRLSIAGLRQILASPFVSQLEYLDLASCRFTRDQPWLELLADCPGLSNLTTLYIYNNQSTQRQCETLANSPYLNIKKTPREWHEHIN